VVSLSTFDYDPFSPEVMRNPLPYYAVLREHFPVYYSEKYDTYFLSRFDDAWEFLNRTGNGFVPVEGTVMERDVLLQHNRGPVAEPPLVPMGNHIHYGSPTLETVRQSQNRPLRPRAVLRLEELVTSLVDSRLDLLLAEGPFDLVDDYAGVVSASTICHLFRMPLEVAEELRRTVNDTTRKGVDDPMEGRDQARAHLAEMVEDVVTARRAEGPDGSWHLVDPMFDLVIGDRALTDREIAVNLMCILIGGTETLPKVVSHGLMELWRHPHQLAAVREDLATNVPRAVEEMLRFCGPAQWFGRTAIRPTTLGGFEVRPGQRVIWLTQSAARDEREFDRPEEFLWSRAIPRTLAFGRGQHFCVGIHLARLEARVMVERFLSRVADYEIDLEGAAREPSSFQWGYSRVPVQPLAIADG
jgi:cytochrome P450